jgi:hypothetical protein
MQAIRSTMSLATGRLVLVREFGKRTWTLSTLSLYRKEQGSRSRTFQSKSGFAWPWKRSATRSIGRKAGEEDGETQN